MLKDKKLIKLVVSVAVIGGLVGASILGACAPSAPTPTPGAPPAGEVYTVKFVTDEPEGTHEYRYYTRFQEAVEVRSGGRLIIEVYPKGTLVEETVIIDAMIEGVTDMGEFAGPKDNAKFPLTGAFALPAFRSVTTLATVPLLTPFLAAISS